MAKPAAQVENVMDNIPTTTNGSRERESLSPKPFLSGLEESPRSSLGESRRRRRSSTWTGRKGRPARTFARFRRERA